MEPAVRELPLVLLLFMTFTKPHLYSISFHLNAALSVMVCCEFLGLVLSNIFLCFGQVVV